MFKEGKITTEYISNVACELNCLQCISFVYVEQTKLKLNIRLFEHQYSCNERQTSKMNKLLSQHRFQRNQNFDFENVKMLLTEPHFNKRLFSDMIFIQVHTGPLLALLAQI